MNDPCVADQVAEYVDEAFDNAPTTASIVTALVCTTDGRNELLAQALDSWVEHLPPFTPWILVDDSGHQAAREFYPRFAYVVTHSQRLGLAWSVGDGWRVARDEYAADYIFHAEDDFVLNGPVPLDNMAAVLDMWPHISQVSLKRQPVNTDEEAAGGFVECDPDAYAERTHALGAWLEHRVCYTLNPHLVPRRVFGHGWPAGNEAGMTANLNASSDNRFAVWGAKTDPPRVHHTGDYRAAGWAL